MSEERLDARRVGEANCDSGEVRFCSETKNDSTVAVPANAMEICNSEVPSSTSILADLNFERNGSENLVGLDAKLEKIKSQLDGLESLADCTIFQKNDTRSENASVPSSSSVEAHGGFNGRQFLQARRRRMRRLRNALADPGVRRSSQRLSIVTSEMLERFGRETKDGNCDTGKSAQTSFTWHGSKARRRLSRYQSAVSNLLQQSSSNHLAEGADDKIQATVGVDLTTVGHSGSGWPPAADPGSSKMRNDYEMVSKYSVNTEGLYTSSPKANFSTSSDQPEVRLTGITQIYPASSKSDNRSTITPLSSPQMAFTTGNQAVSQSAADNSGPISLPFTPLIFSPNMIQGLNALMGSQQILSSFLSLPGGLLANPLSYYAHLSSSLLAINSSVVPPQTSASDVFIKEEIDALVSSPDVVGRRSAREVLTNNGEEAEWSSTLAGSTSDTYAYQKCSSLSRTHSRFGFVILYWHISLINLSNRNILCIHV